MYQIVSFISFLKFLIYNNIRFNDQRYYKIGCAKSSAFALKIFYNINTILQLDNLNLQDRFLYRPISNLKYAKITIDRSLYFLEDCIEFSKEEKIIYKNEKLKSEIHNARNIINKLYIDVDKTNIPAKVSENVELGVRMKRTEMMTVNDQELSKIIYWRQPFHWDYYTNHKTSLNIRIIFKNNELKIVKQFR
jgi:hypothetical protein